MIITVPSSADSCFKRDLRKVKDEPDGNKTFYWKSNLSDYYISRFNCDRKI